MIKKVYPQVYEVSFEGKESGRTVTGYIGPVNCMEKQWGEEYGRYIAWIPETEEVFQSDSFYNVYKVLRLWLRWYAWDPSAMSKI